MATIEEMSSEGMRAYAEQLQAMPDEQLIAQELVQQGAVHALSHLLKLGCTEATVQAMLASLRENAQRIRDEASRRGKPSLFAHDQTNFN